MNSVDLGGQTALHWAAVRGATPVADILLQNGAHPEAADTHGYRVISQISHHFRVLILI